MASGVFVTLRRIWMLEPPAQPGLPHMVKMARTGTTSRGLWVVFSPGAVQRPVRCGGHTRVRAPSRYGLHPPARELVFSTVLEEGGEEGEGGNWRKALAVGHTLSQPNNPTASS